jgi:MYXO-CTERM domain-containing protein
LLSLLLFTLLVSGGAGAFPGFFVAKDEKPRVLRAGQVVVFEGEGATAVTVAADYHGPMKPFALVLPVPKDVTLADVKVLKGAAMNHLEALTAPRFHVFWEQDPCDPGPVEQEWQRDLTVKGARAMGKQKLMDIPRKLKIETEAAFEEGGYTFELAPGGSADALINWLKKKGYEAPAELKKELTPAITRGMKFLVAEVEVDRLELLGDGGAVLAPIRFVTHMGYRDLLSRLGLVNLDGKQDLIVYTIHPENRFEVKNVKTVPAPTNLEVEMSASDAKGGLKERPGEFYAALQDRVLEKTGAVVLTEYVWDTKECGEPCVRSPLTLQALLTFGGDALEANVPDEAKSPEPPELTEEQIEKSKDWKPEQMKKLEEVRKETARRQALVDRQRYVLTRLHYRYDAQGLPEALTLVPAAGGIQGGIDLPKSSEKTIDTATSAGSPNKYQARYNLFRPWKSEMKCEAPARDRWGKRPIHNRVSNKVWSAIDLSRKSRDEIDLAKAVRTPVPALGIPGIAAVKPKAEPVAEVAEKSSGCGCEVVGGAPSRSPAWLALAALAAAVVLRRRR